MTRKDYELIAAAVKRSRSAVTAGAANEADAFSGRSSLRLFAEFIASDLKIDNPRFDRARFLRACGLEE